MFGGYILIAAASISVLAGGYGYIMQAKNKALTLEVAAVRGELALCGARLGNILEDVRDDNTIDNIPAADLRNVPDNWLLPEGNATGN